MKKSTPIYKLAPVSASTAEFLVRLYGASSIEDYAKTLPHSANVLDVGAGNSELGRVIAKLRPDIKWTNFDIEYSLDKLSLLEKEAPKNLKFVNGDILNPHGIDKNYYDRIYAFWVLPHLGLVDPELIRKSIENMLTMLKGDGSSKLTVGPLMGKRTGKAATNYLTAELGKNVHSSDLNSIVRDCTIPKQYASYYRAINRSGLATFKNGERTGQKPTKLGLWDIRREKYVRVLSLRGLYLIVAFRFYLVTEKVKQIRQ